MNRRRVGLRVKGCAAFGIALSVVLPFTEAVADVSPATLSTDVVVSTDNSTASSTLSSPPFTTAAGDEQLLAFISSDGPAVGVVSVDAVQGGGLAWHRIAQANGHPGDSEVWTASAPSSLSGVVVTASWSSGQWYSSMTVASFTGAAPIDHTAYAGAPSGAPSLSIKAQQPGALLWAAGNDWNNAVGRTPAAGNVVLHQYLSPARDTYWVQDLGAPVGAGSVQILGDSAPSSDSYNLVGVEIDPAAAAGNPPPVPVPATRDPTLWPFSSTSIWNMPVGTAASYADPHFTDATDGYGVDEEMLVMSPGSPERQLYSHSWPDRCYQSGDTPTGVSVPIPDTFVLGPDQWNGTAPDMAGGFLMPDGRTFQEAQYLSRCYPGGPVSVGDGNAIRGQFDIYGDGLGGNTPASWGGHGGSLLSALGGTIRLGELTSSDPIRHVLKVDLDLGRYGKQVNGQNAYTWPARAADINSTLNYGQFAQGFTPILSMGSLLAIPPSVDISHLGLETAPARKLAWTLQNYGAYVIDSSGANGSPEWNSNSFATQYGVRQQLETIGIEMVTWDPITGAAETPWNRDMNRIFSNLEEITNQSANAVGGGGSPVQPLAPPFTGQ